MTKDKFEEREVKKYFSNTYDYPGKFRHDIHAIYDESVDKYVLIQYTYMDSEEKLKDLAMGLDNLHETDARNYQELQRQGFVDKNGNYVDQQEVRLEKESSLADKVKKIKNKDNHCTDKCDDCDCK